MGDCLGKESVGVATDHMERACEKRCPICGTINYIDPGDVSVMCFKCKREGRETEVTRTGAAVMSDPAMENDKLVQALHNNVEKHQPAPGGAL